jgi:Exo-beta-D-glucosaminidase Ig-fold domain
VANPSTTIALMAHFQLRRQASGDRVLPVYYSDNYPSLLPGEFTRIRIEAAIADLRGQEPRLMLDGWNVTADPGDGFAVNTEALPSSWPAGGFGPAK